jgi:hypothetical protein
MYESSNIDERLQQAAQALVNQAPPSSLSSLQNAANEKESKMQTNLTSR